jgi:hypothetical protein
MAAKGEALEGGLSKQLISRCHLNLKASVTHRAPVVHDRRKTT